MEQRATFDLEMLSATECAKALKIIRYLTGRAPVKPRQPLSNISPKDDAKLFLDESHVMVGQLGGMYNGDRARKTTLAEFGFRLPSALDNRPLKFDEWNKMRPQTVFVSATPGDWELEQTGGVPLSKLFVRRG